MPSYSQSAIDRFGHPHPGVTTRYLQAGSTLYRTDIDGAVLVTIPPEGSVQTDRYRSFHRRYWLEAPANDRALEPPPEGAIP
ncbi:MAG TPA: hypothetical protein VGC70_10090 [Burkholderiales bacterium]